MDDPDFGTIEFREDCWVGRSYFEPESMEVNVSLPGNENGPEEKARQEWVNIQERYQGLKSEIGSALLKLYSNHVALLDNRDLSEDFPRIDTGDDVWKAFSLISITIQSDKQFELTYCFSESNDDSLFAVSIRNEEIAGRHIGD